jgi:nicotinamidase-related amidase
MKVLVIVDMQYDFVDGALGTPEAQAIVPLVAETIEQLADKNTVILMTKDTHEDNYMDTLEGKKLPVPHCIKGTHGHSIVDEVCIAYGNVFDRTQRLSDTTLQIIEKPTFGSIDFQNILLCLDDEDPITEINFMGLCTGICVMSNAIMAKATIPEAEVNVIEDCCACVTPESHKTALEAMKLCQINII